MDFGVVTFVTDYGIDPVSLGRAVEERGFGSLYVTEHTHIPASRESAWPGGAGGSELPDKYLHTYDPFVALSAIAATTETIRLGLLRLQLGAAPVASVTEAIESATRLAEEMQIAAQGATVDITDSVMTNNLQALGTIRANQTARQTDIANLEAATQSQDVSQQTIMAELQRINQALLLQLRTQQDANQINANLALQQIIAQKQQQDAMKSAFRDSAGYESYYNANITTTSTPAQIPPQDTRMPS